MQLLSRVIPAALLVLVAAVWAGDFQKGWQAYSSGDYETALAEWQELADAGDANACYGVGLMYGNGFGVDMNDDLALQYYTCAAEQGHAEAQNSLGVMHQNGWGVPQSDEAALEWFRLAAEQGVVGAQMALGRYYAMDFLESYDPVAAYKWFGLAGALGDLDGDAKKEFIASRMTPEEIAAGDTLVAEWVEAHPVLFADR